MGAMGSQITSLTIVYSTVHSGTDQRKHQSSALLAFVRGIHRRPVISPYKWPATRKMFPFDDVIMIHTHMCILYTYTSVHTCAWAKMNTSTFIHTYIHLCICTQSHTCICIRTFTNASAVSTYIAARNSIVPVLWMYGNWLKRGHKLFQTQWVYFLSYIRGYSID